MKRLILAALFAAAPLGLATAASKDAGSAAKPAQTAGPVFPDWDQRVAGQPLAPSTDKKAK